MNFEFSLKELIYFTMGLGLGIFISFNLPEGFWPIGGIFFILGFLILFSWPEKKQK